MTLPADVLPLFSLLVCSAALAWCWIRSVLSKRDSSTIGVMMSLAVLLFISSVMLRPAYLFHLGFRRYAEMVLTADEWRGISRVAQEHLRPEGQVPGPGKMSLWDENKHRALWSDLCGATQIQRLDPSLMIFVRPEETEVEWGGALVGHRGVIIFTGKDGDHQRVLPSHSLSIANDIATFVGAD